MKDYKLKLLTLDEVEREEAKRDGLILQNITFKSTKRQIFEMQKMIMDGRYVNRSELMRHALRLLIMVEAKAVEVIK